MHYIIKQKKKQEKNEKIEKKHEKVRNTRKNIRKIQKANEKSKNKSLIKQIKSEEKNARVKKEINNHIKITKSEMEKKEKKVNKKEPENIGESLFDEEETKESRRDEIFNVGSWNKLVLGLPNKENDNDTVIVNPRKKNRRNKKGKRISTENKTKKERSKRGQHIRHRIITHFMNSIFNTLKTMCKGKKRYLKKVNILKLLGDSVDDYIAFFEYSPISVFSVDQHNKKVFEKLKLKNDKNIKLFEALSLKEIYKDNYLLDNKSFIYSKNNESVITVHICSFKTIQNFIKKEIERKEEEQKENEEKRLIKKEEEIKEKTMEKNTKNTSTESRATPNTRTTPRTNTRTIPRTKSLTTPKAKSRITPRTKSIGKPKENEEKNPDEDLNNIIDYAYNLIRDIYQEEGGKLKQRKPRKKKRN